MSFFSIDQLPVLFTDALGTKRTTSIPLGTPCFIQPILTPDDPGTSLIGLELVITIDQVGLFSFLKDGGLHFNSITFENFITKRDILEFTLIANGHAPDLSIVTFDMSPQGAGLDTKPSTFSYAIK